MFFPPAVSYLLASLGTGSLCLLSLHRDGESSLAQASGQAWGETTCSLQSGNTIKIKVGWEEQKTNGEAFSHGGDQRLIAPLPTHALRDAVPGLCCSRGKIQRQRAAPLFL